MGTLNKQGENDGATMKYNTPQGKTCLDEVVESLPIPEFDGAMFGSEAINLDPSVVAELKEYVHSIAESYRDNVRYVLYGCLQLFPFSYSPKKSSLPAFFRSRSIISITHAMS